MSRLDDMLLHEFSPMRDALAALGRLTGGGSAASSAAAMRAVCPLLEKIRDDGQRSPQELERDQYVKVGGDWFRFGGLLDDGRMVLWTLEHQRSPHVYPPTVGETFPFHDGAF